MLVKNAGNRNMIEFVSLEEMAPREHLLRKIGAAVDFTKIYEFVEELYCEDNSRPSIDPVILFKIVPIQHIYGILSLRQTLEKVNMNLAYRWVHWMPAEQSGAALFNREPQLQAPIQYDNGGSGICVPLDIESSSG